MQNEGFLFLVDSPRRRTQPPRVPACELTFTKPGTRDSPAARLKQASPYEREMISAYRRGSSDVGALYQKLHAIELTMGGCPQIEIAQELKISQPTLRHWQADYSEGGFYPLVEGSPASARGRKSSLQSKNIRFLERDGRSIRRAAREIHASRSSVHRLRGRIQEIDSYIGIGGAVMGANHYFLLTGKAPKPDFLKNGRLQAVYSDLFCRWRDCDLQIDDDRIGLQGTADEMKRELDQLEWSSPLHVMADPYLAQELISTPWFTSRKNIIVHAEPRTPVWRVVLRELLLAQGVYWHIEALTALRWILANTQSCDKEAYRWIDEYLRLADWNAARPPVKAFGVIGDFRAFGATRHRRHIISRATTDRLSDWRNDRQTFYIDPVLEVPKWAPLFSSVAVADGKENPKRRSARKRTRLHKKARDKCP
jgi:transposase